MQSDFTPNDPKGEAGSKKAPMWLIPPAAMEEVAWVHRLGSEKYGPFNWRKTGVCATTYVSAIMRHLNAWRDGEDLDPESGFSHIAHIATSCNILIDAARCGTLQDDRNKVPDGVANEPDLGSWLGQEGLAMIEAELDARKKAFESLRDLDPQILRTWADELGDPSVLGHHDATTSPMPDGIEWLGGVYIDNAHRPYPPVPEGYDHWEYRGKRWRENRPVRYGYWTPDREWFVYWDDPSAPCGSDHHYIEAVRKAPAPLQEMESGTIGNIKSSGCPWIGFVQGPPAGPIEIGDVVLVKPVRDENSRVEVVTNIRDIRGEIVYEFANGQHMASSDIYSITKLP